MLRALAVVIIINGSEGQEFARNGKSEEQKQECQVPGALGLLKQHAHSFVKLNGKVITDQKSRDIRESDPSHDAH